MSALERALGWFVEPPARPAARDPAAAPGTCAAVLGRRADIAPIAAALALVLRRRDRAPAALVALAASQEASPAPPPVDRPVDESAAPTAAPRSDPTHPFATAAARRLAVRLEARALQVTVRGRLAWVRLPEQPAQLVAAARRAAAVGVPSVLALAVPRSAAIDAVLADQEGLYVVAPAGALAIVAAESVGALGPPTTRVDPLPAGPSRALALAGLHPGRAARALAAGEAAPSASSAEFEVAW